MCSLTLHWKSVRQKRVGTEQHIVNHRSLLQALLIWARKSAFSVSRSLAAVCESGVNKHTMTRRHYSGNGVCSQRDALTAYGPEIGREWPFCRTFSPLFIRAWKQIRYSAASEMLTRVRNEICCCFILLLCTAWWLYEHLHYCLNGKSAFSLVIFCNHADWLSCFEVAVSVASGFVEIRCH